MTYTWEEFNPKVERIIKLVKQLRNRSPDFEGFETWWQKSLKTEGMEDSLSWYSFKGTIEDYRRSLIVLLALASSREYQLDNIKKFQKSSYYR